MFERDRNGCRSAKRGATDQPTVLAIEVATESFVHFLPPCVQSSKSVKCMAAGLGEPHCPHRMIQLRPNGRRSTQRKILAFRLWPAPSLIASPAPSLPTHELQEVTKQPQEAKRTSSCGLVDNHEHTQKSRGHRSVPLSAVGPVTPLESIMERSDRFQNKFLLGKVTLRSIAPTSTPAAKPLLLQQCLKHLPHISCNLHPD
jgi:hypothetical protein